MFENEHLTETRTFKIFFKLTKRRTFHISSNNKLAKIIPTASDNCEMSKII